MPQNRSPHVAVIMPAYNAEEYIEASVRSILAQTHRELRLIVVDDGSTDGTWALLERLRAEDARLLPIRTANGGPAAARNRGLEAVPPDTEYLMFSDADDLLAPDAVAYALEGGRSADLVILGFSIENADGSEARYFEPEAHYTPETLGAALGRLYKANLLNQVWGKLVRAETVLAATLRFPDYRWGEDRLFLYDCLERAAQVAVLPACKYRYVMHPGESLITRWYEKKFEVCLEADRRMEALCARFGVPDGRDFRYMFMKGVFSCLTALYAPNCTLTRAEKRAWIRRIVSDGRVRERSRDVFGGPAVRLLCAVLRTGNVTLNALCFRLVARIGACAPRLFTALKHRK